MTSKKKNTSPREAAYLAVVAALRHTSYAAESLNAWRTDCQPMEHDAHLAQQIAYGAIRMAAPLDHYAQSLSARPGKALKNREIALVRCALFQCAYLDRIPLYAIANESVALAKKHCHNNAFAAYLNAILRRSEELPMSLPQGDSPEDLSLRYSYPQWFVEQLLAAYGQKIAIDILSSGNAAGVVMARKRSAVPWHIARICGGDVAATASSPLWYIQNGTPAALMEALPRAGSTPQTILDLCAAPGGKLVAAHDLFPEAVLWGNDISAVKSLQLAENCIKYGLSAELSCGAAEAFDAKGRSFDLILLDVPCSNSGVLNKRPEARWRLDFSALEALELQQQRLLDHATTLLAPGGEIWYITCSILPQENELQTAKFCSRASYYKRFEQTIFPDMLGLDGGYACALGREYNNPSC